MAFLKNLKQECVLARGAWIGLLCAAAGAYVLFAVLSGPLLDFPTVFPAAAACAVMEIGVFILALSTFSYGFNFAVQMSVRRRDYLLASFVLLLLQAAAGIALVVGLSALGALFGERGLLFGIGSWLPWALVLAPAAIGLGWLTGAILQRFGATVYSIVWCVFVFGCLLLSRLVEWGHDRRARDGVRPGAGRAPRGAFVARDARRASVRARRGASVVRDFVGHPAPPGSALSGKSQRFQNDIEKPPARRPSGKSRGTAVRACFCSTGAENSYKILKNCVILLHFLTHRRIIEIGTAGVPAPDFRKEEGP